MIDISIDAERLYDRGVRKLTLEINMDEGQNEEQQRKERLAGRIADIIMEPYDIDFMNKKPVSAEEVAATEDQVEKEAESPEGQTEVEEESNCDEVEEDEPEHEKDDSEEKEDGVPAAAFSKLVYDPNKGCTDEELLQLFLQKTCELKRWPLTRELDEDLGMPPYSQYMNRLGGLSNVCDKVLNRIVKDKLTVKERIILSRFCDGCPEVGKCEMTELECIKKNTEKNRKESYKKRHEGDKE